MSVSIRPVQIRDLPSIKSIYSKWWVDGKGKEKIENIDFFLLEVAESISHPEKNIHYLVGTMDTETIVGVIGYQENPGFALSKYISTNKPLQLILLMVDKQYKGKGIGTFLLKYLEKYTETLRFTEIILTSAERWKDSWKFYTNNAYSDLGILENTEGWNTKVFSKKLS